MCRREETAWNYQEGGFGVFYSNGIWVYDHIRNWISWGDWCCNYISTCSVPAHWDWLVNSYAFESYIGLVDQLVCCVLVEYKFTKWGSINTDITTILLFYVDYLMFEKSEMTEN